MLDIESKRLTFPGQKISFSEIRGLPTYQLMTEKEKMILDSILEKMRDSSSGTGENMGESVDRGRALVKTAHNTPNIEKPNIGNSEQSEVINNNSYNNENAGQENIPMASIPIMDSNNIPSSENLFTGENS